MFCFRSFRDDIGIDLQPPNDIIVLRTAASWFSDPMYGFRGNHQEFNTDSETKEAVCRVDPKSGQIEEGTDQPAQPNGLCFSPDY